MKSVKNQSTKFFQRRAERVEVVEEKDTHDRCIFQRLELEMIFD